MGLRNPGEELRIVGRVNTSASRPAAGPKFFSPRAPRQSATPARGLRGPHDLPNWLLGHNPRSSQAPNGRSRGFFAAAPVGAALLAVAVLASSVLAPRGFAATEGKNPGLLAGLIAESTRRAEGLRRFFEVAAQTSRPHSEKGGVSGASGLLPLAAAQTAVTYDIVYVRMPRRGEEGVAFPDFSAPVFYEPGSPLVRRRPDGSETIFVDAGPDGAAFDPVMSFDGQWVYYALAPDVRNLTPFTLPYAGADIYKKHVVTGQVIRLTNQEWTPPSGAANWSSSPLFADPPGTNFPGYGILNVAPCPLPGGKVMFVSNRDTYVTPKGGTNAPMQLFIMDDDGKNVEKVGHLNIGAALHPQVQTNGRVNFSTLESHALRGNISWGVWDMQPDGRGWGPLFSAFRGAAGMHFQAQRSDGMVLGALYYIQNNWGFGTILGFRPEAPPGVPQFGSAFPDHPSNPPVRAGIWYFDPSHPAHLEPRYTSYQFSPPGLFALSGFSHEEDSAASHETDGSYAGKVTHPAGAPGNAVMVVWSPGTVNALNRPIRQVPDAGIYLITNPAGITTSRDLVLVKNDPNYNEIQPRPMVPYSAIYGISEPARLSYLPNDGTLHAALPAGTPFGLVGTSSFYKRETSPAVGGNQEGLYRSMDALGNTISLDSFNAGINGESSNWFSQGSDAGKYSNSDIWAVRIVAQEPVADLGPFGPRPGDFSAHMGAERLRIIGEIPLRKAPGVLDPDGNPDTSFLAKIPADTPFTFQALDRDGLVLNMAQTWHQLRPGEMRADCGGCHAHSQRPTDFFQTAASRPGYVIPNLVDRTQILSKDASGNPIVRELPQRMLDVEYYRDIRPILRRSCATAGCHTGATGAAQLVLNDDSEGPGNTALRLAADSEARYGLPPLPVGYQGARVWRWPNASRYIRAFQSRRSLLMWKIMGRRLDGWTNVEHPTESVPGDPATLPPGADINSADIDYTGSVMPPPGTAPPLTEDEKMTIARWIDLGCPISYGEGHGSWFSDELKPTLTVSSPRSGPLTSPLTQIRIGAYDSYSGLDRSSLSVMANFEVDGRPAGAELRSLLTETPPGSFIWTTNLSNPITSINNGRLLVRVRDQQGNYSVADRRFGTTSLLGLTALLPSAAVRGGAGFTLTLSGSGFVPFSVVRWNGADRPTTLISSTQLRAAIPASDIANIGTASVAVFNPSPGPETSNPFIFSIVRRFLDVPASYWADRHIAALADAGITSGCQGQPPLYCPELPVARNQMAVFLLRAKEGPIYTPPPATGMFTDVPPTNPFAPWIEELARRGITSGCSTSPPMYCPESPVNRAQMAVLLLRTREGSGYTPPPATGTFADVPPANPFAPWIEELARRGITAGCGGGNYCPDFQVTRAQMAVFLVRTFNLALPP